MHSSTPLSCRDHLWRVSFLFACGLIALATIPADARFAQDTTFTPPPQTVVGETYWFHLLSDGKILAGGEKIYRLNSDGTLDASYAIISYPGSFASKPPLDRDGGIVAHGVFYDPTGERSFDGLIRYRSDGTKDETFRAQLGPSDQIRQLTRDTRGRYIVGGIFPSHDNAALIRLHRDGSFDLAFDLGEFAVNALAALPNGQVLVAGALLENNFFKEAALVRLSRTGRILQTKNPGTISALAFDRRGRILFCGQSATVLGRLTARGVPDKRFNPLFGEGPADPRAEAILALADGRIIAGGYFGEYVTHSSVWPLGDSDSWSRSALVRVLPDGTVDDTFDFAKDGIDLLYVKDIAAPSADMLLVLDSSGLRRFIETSETAVVTFAALTMHTSESGGSVQIPVYRMGRLSGVEDAEFATFSLSAESASDFAPITRRVVFKSGEWKKLLNVPIIDDQRAEPEEKFGIVLRYIYGPGWIRLGRIEGRRDMNVIIADDDVR